MRTLKKWPWLSQKARTLLSAFTKAKKDPIPLSNSTARNSKKSVLSNLYHHCSELPLDNFIDALVNGNTHRIVKYGEVPKEEIDITWQKILYEYFDLSGTKTYRTMFALNKEIIQLQARLLSVQTCLKVLNYHPDIECERILRNMGYNYPFNRENPEEYKSNLEDIEKKSRTIKVSIDIKIAEKKSAEKGYHGGKPTEEMFMSNLIELSKYMGFRIKASEITVSEYIAILNKYNKEAENIKSVQGK